VLVLDPWTKIIYTVVVPKYLEHSGSLVKINFGGGMFSVLFLNAACMYIGRLGVLRVCLWGKQIA
jgi:hypothetical protein